MTASGRGARASWLTHPAVVPLGLAVCAMFIIGGLVLAFLPTGGSSTPKLVASTGLNTGTVAAYIVGAVNHSGVYTLPNGSRITDLLSAAGGARQGADLVRVNLAALLFDGEEIYVPLIGEPYPDNVNGNGIQVNINLATAETMHLQLGLSLKTADAIVTYRQTHGDFTSVDQLLLVPISRSIYDRIKALVTV